MLVCSVHLESSWLVAQNKSSIQSYVSALGRNKIYNRLLISRATTFVSYSGENSILSFFTLIIAFHNKVAAGSEVVEALLKLLKRLSLLCKISNTVWK